MVNKKRIIQEFCELAGIDALSYQEREIAEVLKKKLLDLGFQITQDHAGENYGGNCGNIYGFLAGNIARNSQNNPEELQGKEPLLFSAHMDTVAPGKGKQAVVHSDGTITSSGNTVLGADDLSGIVSILEAVRTIQEAGLAHRAIEVLFTIAEEDYIRGSNVYDFSQIRAKEAYVLDLSGTVGTAALAAPTLVSFTVKMQGRASHAGFAPELGINAIEAAAKAIAQVPQGRIDEETTVNIGLIEGGTARNIVSQQCIVKGEVRSLTHEKALAETEKIRKIFDEAAMAGHASCQFDTEFGCISYKTDRQQPVVKRFEKVCGELGYKTDYISTFGGSDNNNFMRHGISGIVLASGMNKVHSPEEFTHAEELSKSAEIVVGLMTCVE